MYGFFPSVWSSVHSQFFYPSVRSLWCHYTAVVKTFFIYFLGSFFICDFLAVLRETKRRRRDSDRRRPAYLSGASAQWHWSTFLLRGHLAHQITHSSGNSRNSHVNNIGKFPLIQYGIVVHDTKIFVSQSHGTCLYLLIDLAEISPLKCRNITDKLSSMCSNDGVGRPGGGGGSCRSVFR